MQNGIAARTIRGLDERTILGGQTTPIPNREVFGPALPNVRRRPQSEGEM
jgi:hypothetical protein